LIRLSTIKFPLPEINREDTKYMSSEGLRLFTAYARLPDQGRRKLDDKAIECVFIGYANQTRGYRLWYPQKGDVIMTKHVKFAEDETGYVGSTIEQRKNSSIVMPDNNESMEETESVHESKLLIRQKENSVKTSNRFNEEAENTSENEG